MAIYTNEHLTDLLNEQYEKVRELEKKLNDAIEVVEFYSEGYGLSTDDSYNQHFENGHIRISTGKRARAFLATLNEVNNHHNKG